MKTVLLLITLVSCQKECQVYPAPNDLCTVVYGETPWALSNIRLTNVNCEKANNFCINHNAAEQAREGGE